LARNEGAASTAEGKHTAELEHLVEQVVARLEGRE
jgi:hypothetical protein